jgi:hypothetical protein
MILSDILNSDVKVSKLSYRKIQLKYNVNILCDGIIVNSVILKTKYKFNEMIPIGTFFYNRLSNQYGIKSKNIYLITQSILDVVKVNPINNENISELLLDRVITGIEFKDKIWSRNYKLSLLNI